MGELRFQPIARKLPRARIRVFIPAAILALALLLVGHAAGAAPKAPIPISPGNGVTVEGMPAFAWTPVAGAEEYEFQIAADAGFASPVFGRGKDDFRTKNTRATLPMTAPNGTYWWRVRAIGRNQAASSWSHPWSFKKTWSARPVPLSPANDTPVVYPSTPLKLTWSPVPGARKYLVSIGTDPDVSSLVTVNGSPKPIETSATAFTPVATLSPDERYYWRVTPEDAEGNLGTPSCQQPASAHPCPSFVWSWPSQTALHVTDLDSIDPEFYDPQFNWTAVPGAARYEVDVNSSRDFAASSKVCCTGTTINTYLSPLNVFKSNTYYWHVRALDMDGHAGVWNCYADQGTACQNPGSFVKVFDNVSDSVIPPLTPPSIKGLMMRDNVNAAPFDIDSTRPGYQTSVPLVRWNPVPGAASYQVDVTPFNGSCLWSLTALQGHYTSNTAVTAWTPLGQGWNQTKPYPDPHAVANEGVPLVKGPHCVRVRARSDRPIAEEIYGDYTYLDCSTPAAAPVCVGRPSDQGWAFDWRGYLPGDTCTARCNSGYLGAGDYQVPAVGTLTPTTPYFTWKPLTWPFLTLKNTSNADALTLRPVRAWETMRVYVQNDPDDSSKDQLLLAGSCLPGEKFTYPDADLANLADQLNADSQCVSATGPYATGPLAPITNTPFPRAGFSSYFVIVAKDPNFTNIIDYALTHVPAYAPRGILGPTTYPDETDGTLYYWAVLPELGWDGTGGEGDPMLATFFDPTLGTFFAPRPTFDKRSLPPGRLYPLDDPNTGQPHAFSDQPRFQWSPVLGARTYRLQISQDQSFASPLEDITTDATAYTSNTTYPADTVLYWRVRANDENGLGLTWSNADSPAWKFQKTLLPPGANCSPDQGDEIPTWSWTVVPGAVSYDVSVDLPNGSHKDLTGYRTPAMTPTVMTGTGVFHWRVRANFPHSPFGVTSGPYSQTCAFTRTIHAPTGAHADFDINHILLSWNAKSGAKRYRVQLSGSADFGRVVEDAITDNTSYAPLLKYSAFRDLNTGRLYWRVAAIDEGDNVGDFTDPQLITRTRRMEISLTGSLKHGKRSKITVLVSDFETYGGVPGVTLRLRGAGIVRRARTDRTGAARLVLRPKRRGSVLITAKKPGYRGTSARFVVR